MRPNNDMIFGDGCLVYCYVTFLLYCDPILEELWPSFRIAAPGRTHVHAAVPHP